MLVGYMRVSKADGSQTINLQRDALLAAGVDAAHLYDDHASGRSDDRPGLASCLKALRDGDTLVVWKLDRLGRNLHHLVNTVHDLTARGVGLKVLTGQGAAIDTTTPAGKLVFGIFAALAEFERELISERTTAGTRLRPRPRPQRRTALQDDPSQAPPCHRLDGPARHQHRRALRRARDHPPNALPARLADRRAATRRDEAPRRQPTQTTIRTDPSARGAPAKRATSGTDRGQQRKSRAETTARLPPLSWGRRSRALALGSC